MRVGLFYIVIFLFLCGKAAAEQGFNLEINFGPAAAKMTGYNDSINTANAYNSSLGITSKLKNLDIGMSPEIITGYDFAAPAGFLRVYLKNSLILISDAGSIAKWPNGITAQSINSDLSALYTGAGARITFASELLPSLSGFAGADAGICHYYWNYIAEETYKEDGGNLYKIRKEWQTAVPGMSVEGGINWWFAENAGISLKGGYRLAAGKVMVRIINISGWTGPEQGEDVSDYSGFYANAGMVFKFNAPAEDKKKNMVRGGAFPSIALWLFNEAQESYEEGLYRQAEQKIKEAEDAAQGNPQIEALREKIQAALKIENNAANVKKLIKQADEYRDKKDFKKARMRYSEALAMEPDNKQARFYMDEFTAKAQEYYDAAAAMKGRGELKQALASAKLSFEYGGGEAAWTLKNSLQAMLRNKKEQDRLFNEGVEQYQKGDYKRAAELWAEVVSIDPDDAEAAVNLEKAREKIADEAAGGKKGIEKALFDAQKAFNIGNMEEAVKKYEYVLRMDEGNTVAARMISEIKKMEEENKPELLRKR